MATKKGESAANGARPNVSRVKRGRVVKIPGHVAALYETRQRRRSLGTVQMSRDDLFESDADREVALNALRSARVSTRKKHADVDKRNVASVVDSAAERDSICDPVPGNAGSEKQSSVQNWPVKGTPHVTSHPLPSTFNAQTSVPSSVSVHNEEVNGDDMERTSHTPSHLCTPDDHDSDDIIATNETQKK